MSLCNLCADISAMVESLNDQLSCPICIEICTEAVETVCCSQLLCGNCAIGLRFCPVCRTEPFTVNVNKSIRRMIGAIPVQCKCGFRTTRGDLTAHEQVCPMKTYICSTVGCGFNGPSEAFLQHVAAAHSKDLIACFTHSQAALDDSQVRDCIGFKGEARIGASGKYYCGQRLDTLCKCCGDHCGPDSGCNCEACMRLDLQARALPKGYLVNKEGRIARVGSKWYCGAKVMSRLLFICDGWCGPDDGPQCGACKSLQRQLTTRYASIVAGWEHI